MVALKLNSQRQHHIGFIDFRDTDASLVLNYFVGKRRSANFPFCLVLANCRSGKLFASATAFAVWALAVQGVRT